MNENERHLLSTDLLRTFVVIADCGNLTVAAGRLHRTQSAISVQLRKLEADLGVALFSRTPKGMILTEAGKQLLPKASAILADIKQASTLFDAPLTGSIRVGIPDDFNDSMLEQILTDFAVAHPGVDVVAISGCTAKYPDAIRDGEMDIAVYSGPDVDGGAPLGVEKIVWAIKRGAAFVDSEQVPLAVLDRSCGWRDLPVDALNSIGRDHKIAFRSSNFASLRAAIRAGFAVGILPVSCVDDSMAILSKGDGFPVLPVYRRAILVGTQTPDDLAGAMTDAIRNAREGQRSA